MINEDYCSYEVAKLLEEKGFNESIRCWYDSAKNFHERGVEMRNSDCISPTIMCPTHQMAMKWLREVHNLFVVIDKHYFVVDKISHIASGFKYSIEIKRINTIYTYNGYKSYEEAVEAALKYVLENLI